MFSKCPVNCNTLNDIMQFFPFQKKLFVRTVKQMKRLNLRQELWNQSQIWYFTCSSFSIVIFNTVDGMYVQCLTINFWYVTHFVIMLMMAMVLYLWSASFAVQLSVDALNIIEASFDCCQVCFWASVSQFSGQVHLLQSNHVLDAVKSRSSQAKLYCHSGLTNNCWCTMFMSSAV